jgi:hypothetical protein
VRLQFKFHESSSSAQRAAVVDEVTKMGAKSVEPLFPDETDAKLATLYKAEGLPDKATESIVASLEEAEAVEFAEPTPERKLIS